MTEVNPMFLPDGLPEPNAKESEVSAPKASPLKAIRRYCLWCCDGSPSQVADCASTACPLWAFRFGQKPDAGALAALQGVKAQPLELQMIAVEVATGSRLKAIRRRCIDCSGGNQAEVRRCNTVSCDLHLFRMGKGTRSTSLTDEQRAQIAARLRSRTG